MTQNKINTPSINPADNDNLTGLMRSVIGKFLQKMDVCLPAEVVAYEEGPPARAQVKINISLLSTGGDEIPRAQIASVPVFQLGSSSFFVRLPIKTGDKGWLIASDRDISLFLQSYKTSKPNTKRMHNFSDGFFIPDIMNDYTLTDGDENNFVIQNNSGDVKISISDNIITMNVPDDIIINGRLIVNGDIASGGNITAVGNITPGTPIPP